ncbi:DUF2382 domain-containing protein [Pseudoroseomonas wenyumeiae]|uniref:DUF2382 domain-containing protein n=1 Tax=Teichococcus wenyumeiae TaxID=2478470 RepID=A0A3A9JEY7_9PROT|nr:DUF2382 domain-containing protein [Pseudoroseomonas wenyumeiae]RKK02186.1 DUF2382 domain-containing protein [Pseudoroseomonas wenyumeiae]RMI15357.1 DUF2382 domain-containing protein [Pseudoroseomonas wenyumeiae]
MSSDPDIEGGSGNAALPSGDRGAAESIEQVIPLSGEVLRVGKRTVEAGRMRVSVSTETAEEVVNLPLN